MISVHLQGLTNLEHLSLISNQISDISHLKGLTNLKSLSLSFNQISDISHLKGLTNLIGLYLRDNQISDVSALAGLTNLTSLYLSKNPNLVDTSPLATLYKNLQYADFEITAPVKPPSSDPSPPSSRGSEDLIISIPDANLAARIRSALGLSTDAPITKAAMLKLTKLDVQRSGISDLTGLECATNLQELYLYNNPISDLSPLQGLTKLTELDLASIQISDLSSLKGLTNLEMLLLYDNQISDLSPLKGLTKLRVLYLLNNQISDVSALAGLTNLRKLLLSGNPNLVDTSPLATLNLEYVDVEITAPVEKPPSSGSPVGEPVSSVDFADTALAAAVRQTLGLADDAPITPDKLAKMTVLRAARLNISDLSGLEAATQLYRPIYRWKPDHQFGTYRRAT